MYPLSLKRRGHVHDLRPGGDPRFLEHDGKAPLLGQHAGDEVLLVGAGRRPPAPPECVPEGPVWRHEAVTQVSREEPQGVARRVLLESAIPHFACGSWVGECAIAFMGLGFAKNLGGLAHSNELRTFTTLQMPTRLVADRG